MKNIGSLNCTLDRPAVDFINLTGHLFPAVAGRYPPFLLDGDELMLVLLRLAHFAPMSIGVKAKMEKNPLEGGPFRMPQPIEP